MSEKGKAILAYVFTWIGGLIVLFGMTVFKSSLIYYKNEVKRYDN